MTSRPLTSGECTLAASVFGDAIDYDRVLIHNRKWFWFQPRHVAMAPDGHIWLHPLGGLFREDFCRASLDMQGLFIHEMTHVAQSQRGGRYYLPLIRHPFCRYDYTLRPGQAFDRYGIEQQAEIVRHAFLLRRGMSLPNKPPLDAYEALLPFNAV